MKLPVVSGEEAVKALARAGFCHVKLRHPAGRDELAPGTLKSILRQAGLTVEEFRRLLE